MSTVLYRGEAAALTALTRLTLRHLPGYSAFFARQRARDFLAALQASGARGMTYPCGAVTLWVEVTR